MKRYQLVPWSTGNAINVEYARRLASQIPGICHPTISYPMCCYSNDGVVWKGTNQRAVLVFSAIDVESAQLLQTMYGECHLECRKTARRI